MIALTRRRPAVRQFLDPAVLVPGLRVRHAVSTALSGTVIQTFTPPPSDAVLRLTMLKRYGVEPTRGAAALVLDTIVFYLARFVAPIIGLVLAFAVIPVGASRSGWPCLGWLPEPS